MAVLGWTTPATASSLTIYDNFQGNGVQQNASISSVVWTLVTENNCTTCAALLTAQFKGTSNYYLGTYLDSVQWVIGQPDVTPTASGFDGFYVNGALQSAWASEWSFALNKNLGANQCGNGNAHDALCGSWTGGGTGGGYGPITAGLTLAWTFDTTFDSELTTATSGNIRGAFNRANGQNYNIFSPGGGTFTLGGCTEINGCGSSRDGEAPPVPEPATIGLVGVGLGALLRRRVRANRYSRRWRD